MQFNKIAINKNTYSLIIISILFFTFGFITWLNALLIPFLKLICQLNEYEAYFVTFSFYISYFIIALPSSIMIYNIGYKNSIITGLLIMSLGLIVFIPAAILHFYFIFLIGLFLQGIGIVILQTAINPYITILGPIKSAARRISIVGICNKLAGIISPLIFANILLKDIDFIKNKISNLSIIEQNIILNELSKKIIYPYLIMALTILILCLIVRNSNLPKLDNNNCNNITSIKKIYKYPNLIGGVISLFFYVGAEVIVIDSIISYAQWLGINIKYATLLPSIALIFMILGYLIGIIVIPKYFNQNTGLKICSLSGFFISLFVCFMPISTMNSKFINVVILSFLGISNSLIWPIIWPLSLNKLYNFTKIGSAILVMGVSGGAIIPLIYGKLSLIFDPQKGYIILILCYCIIFIFSMKEWK